jgi:hypothetical protein
MNMFDYYEVPFSIVNILEPTNKKINPRKQQFIINITEIFLNEIIKIRNKVLSKK